MVHRDYRHITFYQDYRDQILDFLSMFAERKAFPPGEPRPLAPEKLDQEFSKVLAEVSEVFNDVLHREPRTEHEKIFGVLHSIAIEEAMIRRRGFSSNVNEKFFDIMQKCFLIDRETGLYDRQAQPDLIGLAHLHTQMAKDMPVCIIRGDGTNFGNSNKYLGREETDKALHHICKIMEKNLSGKGVTVQGFRIGGDEIGFIVYGRTASEVQALLDNKIHPEINLFAAQIGAGDIPHHKAEEGKLPGFGAAFGCADLNDPDQDAINDALRIGIEFSKERDAFLRYGLISPKDVTRYMNDVYIPYLINHGKKIHPEGIEAQYAYLTDKAKEISDYWNSLIAAGGVYHDAFENYRTSGSASDIQKSCNPRDFFAFEKKRHQGNLNPLKNIPDLLAPLTAKERIPFWKDEPPQYDEDPVLTRMRGMLEAIGFPELARMQSPLIKSADRGGRYHPAASLGLNGEQARIIRTGIDLMHRLDMPDPASRCKSARLMLDDAKMLCKKKGGLRILRFELTNLSGLNNVSLNGDLANAVLRTLGRFIKEGIKKQGEDTPWHEFVYHQGNGKFNVFLPPDYPESAIAAIEEYVKDKMEELKTRPIDSFARETFARVTAGRTQEKSDDIIKALRERFAEGNIAFTTMAQIPHPSDRATVGIKSFAMAYDPQKIDLTIEQALDRAEIARKQKSWLKDIRDKEYPPSQGVAI